MHHCKRGKRPIGRNFTIALLGLLIYTAGLARAEPFPRVPRTDPPAVLVRLSPEASARIGLLGERVRLEGALQSAAAALEVQAVQAPYEEVLRDIPAAASPNDPEERLRRSLRLVLLPGADPKIAAARLAKEPGVESAEPDAVYHLAGISGFYPNDSFFQDGTQWGLYNTGSGPFGGVYGVDLRAPTFWLFSTGSTSTVLGIVDTGFDLHHPELGGLLADGTPRIIRAFNSSIEGPDGAPDDSVGHGTIVAGVAFARTNNGPVLDGLGVAGMCGGSGGDSAGCRIVEVKATPTRLTDALASELTKGIAYAVIAGARAINLSFGGDDDNSDVRDAMSFAQRRGAIVICGAGNGQDERPQYPGYYARYGVGVSVAAIKSDGTLARFSSRGPQIDVAAPGEDIQSTYLTYQNAYGSPFRNWVSSSGTSFAAPFVTGLAGLAYSIQPDMIDNEFQAVLRRTARDVGDPGRDDVYGWGIPDPHLLLALQPPRRFERGTIAAQSWSLVGTDTVSLSKTRMAAAGCSIDGRYLAERWEVRAHVTIPTGKLLEIPQVIVRVHGTNGQGGWPNATLLEYDGLDWGEAVPGTVTPNGFDLRTYVYRIPASPPNCTNVAPIDFVPQQPKDIRFAWSALARRDAAPTVRITAPAAGAVVPVDQPTVLRWTAFDPDSVSAIQVAVSSDSGRTYATVANLTGNPEEYAWQAPCAQAGRYYRVRVRALDQLGVTDQGEASIAFTPDRECLDGEDPQVPPTFAFLPPTPNPSSGPTAFHFYLPDGGGTRSLRIYDVRGRLVRTIAIDAALSGPSGIAWDGRDEHGTLSPAGMFIARLSTTGGTASRRFVRL